MIRSVKQALAAKPASSMPDPTVNSGQVSDARLNLLHHYAHYGFVAVRRTDVCFPADRDE